MLEAARYKILNRSIDVRRESLEKLWDAWERLKTVEPGRDKRESAGRLLDKAATEPTLRTRLEEEAIALTNIGNTFMIRHTEIDKIPFGLGTSGLPVSPDVFHDPPAPQGQRTIRIDASQFHLSQHLRSIPAQPPGVAAATAMRFALLGKGKQRATASSGQTRGPRKALGLARFRMRKERGRPPATPGCSLQETEACK